MSKKFDIVAITGKFTDGNGQEKNRYTNIGVVLETAKGLSIKLEAIPVGWDGWAGLYEPKPKDGEQQRPQQRTSQSRAPAPSQRQGGSSGFDDGMDPDIPFADPLSRRGLHLAM